MAHLMNFKIVSGEHTIAMMKGTTFENEPAQIVLFFSKLRYMVIKFTI